MAFSRKDKLEELRHLIGVELSGLQVPVSFSVGFCEASNHRGHFHIRRAGEWHTRCDKCDKCIVGSRPQKKDGTLEIVLKQYKKILEEPPDDVDKLRSTSAPPHNRKRSLLHAAWCGMMYDADR